jgi:putative thioredoxin
MSRQDNPFGGAANPYAATVSYGAAPAGAPLGGQASAPAIIKDTTTAGFAADVIQESRNQPVLVDFWAPWCGPCKQLQPALERVVAAAGGRVKLVKMNIDDHPAVAGQLGIQSIPAVIAFKDGKPVDGFMGAVPESQIREFIERVAGPGQEALQIAEAMAAAAEAVAAQDLRTAAEIYDAVLEQEPQNIDAIAGLAEILFDAGDAEGTEEVLSRVPEDKRNAPKLVALRTRMDLAAKAAALGDPAALERRLAANPNDHEARFDLAVIQNALGQRTEAADNLLFIFKADRTWREDGARAQLLQFFEAWGMMDDVTLATRRKLSSILFS